MRSRSFVPMMIAPVFAAVSLAALLSGCGIETAGTAATAAQLKAQEAEQARQQLEAAKKELDAAQQVMQKRIEEADRNAAAAAPPADSNP